MPSINKPTVVRSADADDPTVARSLLRRFRTDRFFRRSLYSWVTLSVVLAADVVYLCVAVPQHPALLRRSLFIAACVLLPLLIFAVVVRSPWGRARIRPGYTIRPFATLKTKPDYDGTALAAFLEREIGAWRIQSMGGAQPKSAGGGGAGGAGSGATLSLGGATVSIPWLWTKLLYAVSANKDFLIDGLLLDADTPLSLRVWSSSSSSTTWEERLGSGTVTDELREAFRKLALDVLEELEPRTAGLIYNSRWRDADAVRLLLIGNRPAVQDLELVYVYMDGGYLQEADELLPEAKSKRLRGDLSWQVRALEAQLRQVQGQFTKAEEVLTRMLSDTAACPHRWKSAALRTRADSLVYQGRYEEALTAYQNGLDFLKSLQPVSNTAAPTGAGAKGPWAQLAEALASKSAGLQPEVLDSLLLDIQGALRSRASCLLQSSMQQKQPQPTEEALQELLAAREVLEVRSTLPAPDNALQIASLNALVASLEFDAGKYTESLADAASAVTVYEQIERMSQSELLADPRNMKAQVDVAWCCLRLWVCYSLIYSARKCLDPTAGKAAAPAAFGTDPAQKPPTVRFAGYGICVRPATGNAEMESIATVLQELSDNDRGAILAEINRASLQMDSARQEKYLWKAALVFSEVILRRQGPGAPDVRGIVTGRTDDPQFADPDVSATVAAMAAKYGPQTDLIEVEVRRLCDTLHNVVEQIGKLENRDPMNMWLQTAAANTRANNYGQRVVPEFTRLAQYAKRPNAESAYGMGCYAAISGDGPAAANYLQQATRRAGDDTFLYRNRVPLDEQFVRVRGTKEVEDFLRV